VGLEVLRCLCIIDAGNVFISTILPGRGAPARRADKKHDELKSFGRFWYQEIRDFPNSKLLVLLVNDSEYKNFTGTQPIPCRWCIYLVSPGALLLRAPPHPAPLFWGKGKYQKSQKKRKSWAWARWRWRYVSLEGFVC
jgi:hypothetical protein